MNAHTFRAIRKRSSGGRFISLRSTNEPELSSNNDRNPVRNFQIETQRGKNAQPSATNGAFHPSSDATRLPTAILSIPLQRPPRKRARECRVYNIDINSWARAKKMGGGGRIDRRRRAAHIPIGYERRDDTVHSSGMAARDSIPLS